MEYVKVKQATKQGYTLCKIGGVLDISYPSSETRRGRVEDQGNTSPTLTTQTEVCKLETSKRIRRLTPRECWRLMDFDDQDFDAARTENAEGNLYKQAGNSIVVNVLAAIFGQMIPGKEDNYKNR